MFMYTIPYMLMLACFLKIALSTNIACVLMCVCPWGYYLITSVVMWTLYDWLNKFYSYYIVTVVSIVDRRALELIPIEETSLIRES